MTAVDRSTVIMSIRLPYADAIMAGTKLFEFRRKPLPDQVRSILVYRSGLRQVRGVVGILDVIGQETASCYMWGTGPCARGYGHTKPDPRYGISINDLADYAGGITLHAQVTGISVRVQAAFPMPVPLDAFGITTAPQSWRYAPVEWGQIVRQVIA